MRNTHFSLLKNLKDLNCGMSESLVRSSLSVGQYIYQIWLKIVWTNSRYSYATNCAPLVADLFLFC